MSRHLLLDLAAIVTPSHTALVAIDMQNDFCADDGYTRKITRRDVSTCQAVVEPITRLAAGAGRAGVPIVWVKADYDPRHLPAPILAKRQASGKDIPYCVAGTWGAEFYGVAPDPGDLVVTKHRHSAFRGTELDNLLRDRRIESLVIVGVQTHVCVESTLRDASAHGYYVVVPRDCVGSHTPDLHEATLKSVQMHFGEVTTSAELVRIWSAGHVPESTPALRQTPAR